MTPRESLTRKRAKLVEGEAVNGEHESSMKGEETEGQASEGPAPVSAGAILRDAGPNIIFVGFGVAVSMLLSVVLVGFLFFATVVTAQIRAYQKFAFNVESRRSWTAPVLVLGLAFGAIFICGTWIALFQLIGHGHFHGMDNLRGAILTLPVAYCLAAWILLPLPVLIVLLLDPKAPRSLRHLVPLALRVTSEIPARNRVAAVLLSGAVLVGPVVVASLTVIRSRLHLLEFTFLWSFVTVPLFIPIASALLVANYSRVRHELSMFRGELPNFPAGLALLTAVTLVVSGFATFQGFDGQPLAVLLLGLAWLAIVAALMSFLSAHRIRCLDPLRQGAAPGRRALEGKLHRRESGHFLVAGPLSFRIPDHALGDSMADGTTMTLIGDFAATTEALFRDRAEQVWPKGAKLHTGGVASVVSSQVRFATWVSYLALTAAVLLSGEILTNIY